MVLHQAVAFSALGGPICRVARETPRDGPVGPDESRRFDKGGTDPFVTGKLARTCVELGKYADAVSLDRPLAELDDHDPVPAVTLGVALAASGDPAGARDARAGRLHPADAVARSAIRA